MKVCPMKKVVRKIIVGLFVITAGIGIFYLVSVNKEENNKKRLVLYGNVDIREVDLGFRVSGKVLKLFFDEGDKIKAGDLLAILDKQPYEEKVWKATADLQATQISLSNAQKQYERRTKAITTAAISEEDFENAEAKQEELMANLASLEASLAIAMTDLGDTELFSPSDGVILTRIREPGSILSIGEPVFTLSLDAPIWIRAYIAEPDLGKIYPGMQAEIHTDSSKNHSYKGHIGFISPVAEFTPKNVETPELRTDLVFRLRIIVDNPDQGLRQGMPVTVTFLPNTSI